MAATLIRTEMHALRAPPGDAADLRRGRDAYRRLVRVLSGIIFVNLPELVNASSKCFAVEHLFHATADNPTPRYAVVDRMFPQFPSYLRRAAIEAAFGAVSSYLSNYRRWQGGQRAQRSARPPQFARMLDVNPPLYAGNCIRFSEDRSSVRIKALYCDGRWGWTSELAIRGRFRRPPVMDLVEALSPSLLIKGAKVLLAFPVEFARPKVQGGDVVCATDLGLNTGATCAIVDSSGAVRARAFFSLGRHDDRMDKAAGRIRNRAEKTLGPRTWDRALETLERPGELSRGFCTGLYARIRGLSRAAAQTLANRILAFATLHGASSLVFEDLKSFRPTGGRKNSSLRQRFHRWTHRLVVKKATFKAEEAGLRVAFVYARGTSAWAHDGSGEVRRDARNYALCTFASGKQYNADLNAALNIAARFICKMLGVTTGDRPAAVTGKSSGAASRMPIVLADVWRHAGAPV